MGQTDRGIISGTVTDSTGAIVPNAKITATNVATNVPNTTQTTGTGNFRIPSLPPGRYNVRIEADGFKAYERTNVAVIAGGLADVDATMEVGAITESISVTSSLTTVQTETAKVTTQVSTKMIDELPLVVGGAMRGAFDLAALTPTANIPDRPGDQRDRGFSVGGGQAGAYGATLDGISVLTSRFNSIQWANVNTPSIDGITEFAVETNGFKAEFGRGQGGIITFASKSGTNELHGTAYEFLRNNALDARRFFEARKAVYKQHDFGFSVGGPVYIPKLYNGKNRSFFFATGEWFRNRVGAESARFSVPTAEMYQGDFRNWVDANGNRLPIYDPDTTRPNPSGTGNIRDPFPNNMIPQGRFSPLIQNYLKVVGTAQFPNNGAAPGTSDYVRNNFINSTGTRLDPWTKVSAKGDHNFTDNTKVSFLYNRGIHRTVPGPDGFPGLPGLINTNRIDDQRSDVYRGTVTKIISPTLVYYGFGGVNFWKERHDAITLDGNWSSQGVCLQGAWDCNRNLMAATFSDYNTWVANAYDGSENFVFSFGNDLTWIRGKHSVKFGYLWERLHYNGFGQQWIGGAVSGDRRSTSVPGNNNLNTGGGNGFASLLIGHSYGGGTENDRFVGQQWRSHSFYIQDDWKVTPRLTLNLGLRYEFTLPPQEQLDKWSDFSPTKMNPRAGIPGALIFAGFGEGRENSRTITPGWYGGIGPRLGLAYNLDHKTVLRASGGLSYGVVKTIQGSTHFEGAVLIFRPTSLDEGVTPSFLVDQGLPPYTPPPSIDPSFSNGNNTAYWDNEAVRLPVNYQWTFSLQRQVSNSIVVEAAYQATMGAHLMTGLKRPNQLPFSVLQQYGRSVLTSNVESAAAREAGITRPYASIDCDFSRTCAPVSVAQALRPFPQYLDIQTASGNGDKSGHSTFHSALLKLEKAYSAGLTLQGSYVLSKLLTDADTYDGLDYSALDHYNRRLEKSIGAFDVTHNFKFNYIYELPFGKGKPYLSNSPLHWVLGGWRIGGVHFYTSGFPLALNNSVSFPIFNGRNTAWTNTYDGWIVNQDNPNWRGADRYFQQPSYFGPQDPNLPGNATRFNPKARAPWVKEVNYSLAKSFQVSEAARLDFRWEMFNAFNTPRFNPGSTNVQNPAFGQVNSTLNEPRRMQLGLKLYW
ncbi:MAG: TonB-dependent receptor [Bryobacteraceae bacterium]|nr:TonB-dependent receptor [Bryobacteraceae bacterium]